MARETNSDNADLLSRIAELEAENAALHRAAVQYQASAGRSLDRSERPGRHGRGWGWTLLAVVLIVVGAVLAPLAVVASWAKVQLTETDTFVATYSPLANDPAVQSFVTDKTMEVIAQKVDIPKITSQVVDGIISLGTGPVATRALQSLKAPAAQGITSLVRSTVSDFVRSAAFAQVWKEALRATHTQFTATMRSDPKAAIAIGSDGSVGIQLAPIIQRVKEQLVAKGITFASKIPVVHRTITVAQNSSLPTIQLFYGVAIGAGAWLPWVALLFLAAGVIVARRRALALVWASIALALAMLLTVSAFTIGQLIFVGSVSPSLIPAPVAVTIFETLSTAMRDTGVAVLVLAVVVALVAWYSGPFAAPRRLRGFFGSGAAWVRNAAETHGVSTAGTGRWLYRLRALLRGVVAVIAAAIVLFVRPLTVELIVWTLVGAVVVVALLELLQRPTGTVPEGIVPVEEVSAEGVSAEADPTH
ncbi:MAG: hypothetical protein ACHP7F_01910 [Actinomycetales bacterium]|jgi:hypothetical protein|nr:hypothetical protein [Leifsonia sp.]